MSLHERMSHERAWNKGPGISEGADLEKALLGRATVDSGETLEYMPFDDAVAFAKQHQPSVFKRSKELKELREKIAQYATDPTTPVRFYTAVGTPLDIYHGVDDFFEQGSRMVTLDVSMREKEHFKADVLLVASLDDDGKVAASNDALADAAAQAAAKLGGMPASKVA